MSRCDLCHNMASELISMCNRRECRGTKHICHGCLEEAALKYTLMSGNPLEEVKDTLREVLGFLKKEDVAQATAERSTVER